MPTERWCKDRPTNEALTALLQQLLEHRVVRFVGVEMPEDAGLKMTIKVELREEEADNVNELVAALDTFFEVTDEPRYVHSFELAGILFDRGSNLMVFDRPTHEKFK